MSPRKPAPVRELRLRYTRFRVACVLEGQGAAQRFAEAHNTTSTAVCHCLDGKPSGRGAPIRRSWRLEQAADNFIKEIFRKHADVLQLPEESP